ncbi:MAG: PEP-CTERM sorting domain-containing protein [Aureliella sp.]
MLTRHQFFCPAIASMLFCVCSSYSLADLVTLIPEGGFPTGANINALAGPLFASDFDEVDIAASGMVSASASKDGNFATHTSAVELDFSGGSTAFFESVFDETLFSRTATLDHRASAESIFFFSVDVPTEFEIMGSFAVDDAATTTIPGNVELEIELLEFDAFDETPSTMFYNHQVSTSEIDAAFMVGGMDGDTTNVLDGAPMGLLDPTKVYRYRTLVTTNAIDIDDAGPILPTDGAATAMGAHTILFTGASVPEPGSILILAISGLVSNFHRRRRV